MYEANSTPERIFSQAWQVGSSRAYDKKDKKNGNREIHATAFYTRVDNGFN